MSWTLDLFRTYAKVVSLPSVWTLRQLALDESAGRADRAGAVAVRLRGSGVLVELRPYTNDLFTFKEVFVSEAYRSAKSLSEVRNIVDIGANAGFASVYFRTLFPGSSLLAVEPDPRNIAILTRNIPKSRSTVMQAALWRTDADIHFEFPPVAEDMVSGTAGETANERTTLVRGLGIESILDQSTFPSIDILKIDVEGAERHIFEGGTAWLKRVKAILIEFHGEARAALQFDDVMRTHGFNLHDDGHTVLAHRRPAFV